MKYSLTFSVLDIWDSVCIVQGRRELHRQVMIQDGSLIRGIPLEELNRRVLIPMAVTASDILNTRGQSALDLRSSA